MQRSCGESIASCRPGRRPLRLSAYEKALSWLARREYSQSELRRKLERGGYTTPEVTATLTQLVAECAQDDARFADMLLRRRINQGYGPLRICMELKMHGLEETVIRQLLRDAAVDWDGQAMAQWYQHIAGQAQGGIAARAKSVQFLLRRGFSADTVRRIARTDVTEDPC